MNNSLDYAALSVIEENAPESTQYITFNLAGYLFGLPSKEILRVVATPPANQGGLISMGMVQLGPYSIQMIDLVSLLALNDASAKSSAKSKAKSSGRPDNRPDAKSSDRPGEKSSTQPSVSSSRELEHRNHNTAVNAEQNPPFLVVLQNDDGEFWGIALHSPPDLMEVPNYAIKPVPTHRRTTQSLQWVSHIVNYDLNSNKHALLVLDLSLILDPEGKAAPKLNETANLSTIQPPLAPPTAIQKQPNP